MANIDNYLDTIMKAPRGEDVRIAIKEAIKQIWNDREYPPTTLRLTQPTSQEGVTGGPWDRVIANFDDAKAKIDLERITQPISDNGFYDLATLKRLGYVSENCQGINEFSVDVPQTNGNFTELEITENGTYDPLVDGYDGYSKVYVHVLGNGEPGKYYTVRFFDGNRLLQTQQVLYGQSAVYDGAPPTTGGVFTGWNPNPSRITGDIDVQATYMSGAMTGGSIAEPWSTIIQRCKSGAAASAYPVGSTKDLILQDSLGNNYILLMMVVGHGIDANANGGTAKTTWININLSDNAGVSGSEWRMYQNRIAFGYTNIPVADSYWPNMTNKYNVTQQIWWETSLMRALLNKEPDKIAYRENASGITNTTDLAYYNALATANDLFPDLLNKAAGTDLWGSIEPVKKYSSRMLLTSNSTVSGGGSVTTSYNKTEYKNQATIDKIWVPSSYEMTCGMNLNVASDKMSNTGVVYPVWDEYWRAMKANSNVETDMLSRDSCGRLTYPPASSNGRWQTLYTRKAVANNAVKNNVSEINAAYAVVSGAPAIPIGFCI